MELASLETSLKQFNDNAKNLARSVEKGKLEMVDCSEKISGLNEEIKEGVREWARGVTERSGKMVEELLEHQKEHLTVVCFFGHFGVCTSDDNN